MTVGVDSKGSGEGGVGNRAGEGKWRTTFAVATKGIIAMAVRETTPDSLIIGVSFGKIVLPDLGVSMKTMSMMTILNGVGQLTTTCP